MSNGRRPQPAALVQNAADPQQVRFAQQFEKRRRERFENAMLAVLGSADGRIVLAELVKRAGVYRSIWHPSSEIHYNAGRQDYGHELMADLVALDEDLFQLMEREDRAWAKHEQAVIEAAHLARRKPREPGEHDGSE